MSEAKGPIDLDALGTFVATHHDGADAASSRLAGRERLIRHVDRPAPSMWLRAGGVAVLGLAAVLVFWWWPRTPVPVVEPAVAQIDGEPLDSEWMQAPLHGRAALPVGDGAMLALHDGARGRVQVADRERVAVVLEAGRLEADIDPQAHRRVTIEAGPYRVGVVGTVFRVEWEPSDGAFAVEVTRGKVEVRAPSSSAPIAVDAGRRLLASGDGALSLVAIDAPRPAVEPEPPIEITPPVEDDTEGEPGRTKPRPHAKPEVPAPPSWRSLASDGKYAEALAAVEASGFDAALSSLPADQLEQLGDAARLARAAKAEQVYLAVRKRFAGTAAAARAAFQLGRAASAPKDAVRWLRTYLDEAPQGSFAKLARGRLIAALSDAGDRIGARDAARVYLDSYPDGPHAKIARALLESP